METKMTDIIHSTEEELLKRDAHAYKCAKEYADYLYQERIYKDVRDAFLEAEKMRIRSSFKEKISDAELTCRVKGSNEWVKFLDEQHKILREAGRLKIKYENAVRSYEAYRSALSARKKEIERNK